MSLPKKNVLPSSAISYFNNKDRLDFSQYLQSIDALLAALAGGNLPTLINAANDAKAKIQGVQIGQMYRNGSVLMVRVT